MTGGQFAIALESIVPSGPDWSNAWATWIGVGISLVIGILGVIFGAVGMRQAAKANEAAVTANRIAEEANRLADEANGISRGQAEKQDELHRIDWDWEWVEPGAIRVFNLGPDAATHVVAQVTVDGDIKTARADSLESGAHIDVPFPSIAFDLRREREEKASRASEETGAPFGFSAAMAAISPPDFHSVRTYITWRSPAGNPKERDSGNNIASLGEDD